VSTARRPSTPHLWVPLLVVLLVIGLFAVTRSRSVEEVPAGSSTSAATGSSSSPASRSSGSPGSAGASTPASGLPTITESALPEQARQTLSLIRAGGPYPYRQDDGVFANREGVLPRHPRSYYREYTVLTPGEPDRGPRRIIRGANGDLYWTTDHYASFRQILEGR
jgi:ribonuclease T1